MVRSLCLAATIAAAALPQSVLAVDRVIKTDGSEEAGTLDGMTRDTVTLKSRTSGEQQIKTADISFIDFDAAPAAVAGGRAALQAGNVARAAEQFADAAKSAPDDNDVKREIEYLQAAALAAQAADPTRRDAAIAALQEFTSGSTKHYRYYPALLMLGRMQSAAGQYAQAKATFGSAASAPYPEFTLAANVGQADAALADGKLEEARRLYDDVVGKAGPSAGQQSQKLAARLGQAKVLSQQKQYDQAITTLEEVVRESGAGDTRVQAEAFLRQGDAYAAQGNQVKAAILAYLRVDVVPALAKESELHAEALYRLKELWPAVAKPTRAAEAASRLQSLYPDSEWTKKIGG